MNKIQKIFIFFTILSLFGLFFVLPVLAQEIMSEELEVKTPQILPTSNTYFLKDFLRQVKMTFTFSPLKKAELRLKFANEKLIETRELVKIENVALIERGLNQYQKELDKLKKGAEKLTNLEKEKFLEKYVNQTLKQQMVLENIASQVRGEVYEKILENRNRHLERFKEVMERVENKEIVKEKIRKATEDVINVSPLRTIKILETIKEIEEKAPEEMKPKIEEIKQEIIGKTKTTYQVFPPKIQAEKIKEQINFFANPLMAQEVIEEIKKEAPEIILTPETLAVPVEMLQEKIAPLPEEKRVEVLEKIVGGQVKYLERLQEVKEKLESLPVPSVASEVIGKMIEKQLQKLETKIEEIKTLPSASPDLEKIKEELKEAPKIKKEIIKQAPKLLEIKELELKEVKTTPPIKGPQKEELSGFCGRSTYGSCKTDNDCLKGGCSSQICQAKDEEPIITTCEWRDCYDAEKYGVKCGCFNGKCQWGKAALAKKEYFYFGYGSNMNLQGMKSRCPETYFLIGKARLPDYEFFFVKSGVANIKESKGKEVWGVLYKIKEKCLSNLDRYEGYPRFYQRREVEVERNEEEIKTLVYIIEKDKSIGKPSSSYLDIILEGARENNLPETYIEMIKNWNQ